MHFNEVCVVTGVFDQSPLCLLSVFLVFRSLHSTIFPTHTRWLKLKQNSAQKHHCHHHCHAWFMRWQSRWMPLNPLRPLRVVSSLSQATAETTPKALCFCLYRRPRGCGALPRRRSWFLARRLWVPSRPIACLPARPLCPCTGFAPVALPSLGPRAFSLHDPGHPV